MQRNLTGIIVIGAALLVLAAPLARSEEDLREPDNKGSVLYFSLAPDLRYADSTSYRGRSLSPRPEEAIVTTGTGPRPQIAYLLAAFPPEGRPELSVVTFGMRYSKSVHLLRWGISPPSLQLASRDWPASGEGLMFGLTDGPDTSSVVELAWFAFQASSPGFVEIIPHPEPQNAIRVIASNPPVPIPVAGVGSLGFGRPGSAPAFSYPGPTLGAACSYDSICVMLTREEVEYYGKRAIYLGEGTDCIQGALCRGPMLSGACCMPDGTCRTATNKDCSRNGGIYRGNFSLCDTVSCQVPVTTPGERKGP